MLLIERLDSKKISKTMAVAVTQPNLEALVKESLIHAGSSGYVEFLGNTKVSYIYIKAKAFAGSVVEIDLKLKVDDKAMASAVLVDVIRLVKILRDHGIGGAVEWASAFYFKYQPINPRSDYEALKACMKVLKSWARRLSRICLNTTRSYLFTPCNGFCSQSPLGIGSFFRTFR